MFKPISRDEYHKIKWDKEIFWKDDCPFCEKNKNKSHIIWEWKYWFLLYNISSYSWDHRHIMAIPNEHICFNTDLTPEYFKELLEVHKKVKSFFNDEHYFSFTRESIANRSVEHLHMHFLVGNLQWKFLRKMLEVQWYPIKQKLNISE